MSDNTDTEQVWVGFADPDDKGRKAHGREETQAQIDALREYDVALTTREEEIEWADVYDPDLDADLGDEKVPIFNHLLLDRETRVDEENLMANRPAVAIVTHDDEAILRLEYYDGHDALSLTYDLRAPEYDGPDEPTYTEGQR